LSRTDIRVLSRTDIRAGRHGPHLLHSAAAGRWDVLGARFSRKALSRALASSSLTAIAVIRLSIKSPVSGSARATRGNAWTIAKLLRTGLAAIPSANAIALARLCPSPTRYCEKPSDAPSLAL